MDTLPKYRHEVQSVPHALIDTPLRLVVDFHLEHLERDTKDGKLRPTNFWIVNRGLLLGSMQSYANVCLLLAEKRPKPFLSQAGIINRAIFETLVNVVALIEEPSRVDVLEREGFKNLALRYQDLQTRFGSEPKWQEYLRVYRQGLDVVSKSLRISREELNEPSKIAASWPTPWPLIFGQPKRKSAPWGTGSRQQALKMLYRRNYPHQSALAHQRIAAVSAAMLAENPEFQWNPGLGESDLVATATLLLICLLAELQAAANYPRHPRLAELWAYSREFDDEAKELWAIRYENLVGERQTHA